MAPPSLEVADIIRRKKHRYGQYVDTHEFSKMSEIILPDAKMIFLEEDGKPTAVGKKTNVFDSREAYCKQIGGFLESGQTTHMFGYGDLEQTGPNEVTAVFSMIDTFVLKGSGGWVSSSGAGHYHEKWVKKGDDWFMAELRLERLNVKGSFLFGVIQSIMAIAAWFGIDVTPS